MTDTVDKIIVESSAPGAKQAAADVQGLSKAMDGVTVASEKVEKSTTSVDGKFAALERRLGTTAAQARQFEKDQKTINAAVAQNPALASRASEATAALAARYSNVGKEAVSASKSIGLARHEIVNVSRQIQDIGVSLFSGQSPLTVAVQQVPQIADVFASSEGTVKGFFDQVLTGAGRLLTPMRVLAGGVAGIGAAAAYIGGNWADAERQVSLALTGIGRRSGETLQSINKFSTDNASATGLSIAEARNVAVEFAKTGTLAASGLKGVGDAVRGYAIMTGKDATEATKELAGSLSGDLVQAALKVDSTYGVMNAAVLENVRSLEAQGKRAEAVQIILDRMAPANLKAAESVGFLSKAWDGFKNIVSNVTNGAPPVGQSPQEQRDSVIQRRDEFQGSNIGRNARGELVQFADAQAKAEAFRRELEAVQQKLDTFNADQAQAALDGLSAKAFAAGNAILPQIDAIAKLDAAIRMMQEAQSKGVGPANSSGMIAVYQQQKDLLQESLNATIRQAQYVQQLQTAWGGVSAQTAVALASMRDQLNVAQQVTGAGQMRAQQQATVNQLLREGKDLEEASAIALEQKAVAEASATANVERQTQALRDQNAMIRARQNGTEATTAAAIAYRNAIESGADATAAAALRAETLKNNLLQAGDAAGNISISLDWSEFDASVSREIAAQNAYRGYFNEPSRMGAGGSSRSEFEINPNPFLVPSGSWTDPELLPVGAGMRAALDAQEREMAPIRERHQQIIDDLKKAIEDQTKATEANTSAITVGLNPLYTQGRGAAIEFGYMHAAKGLDFIAHGPPSGDQVHVPLKVNGGERVTVQTVQQQANDNGRSTVVNNNIVINESGSTSRRNLRHLGQRYGSMLHAMSK